MLKREERRCSPWAFRLGGLIPRKESNAMKKNTTSTAISTYALKAEALASMSASFERFCLAAGLETLSEMLEQDATAACGERHERGERRQAHRWGRTKGKIGFHGGKVDIERPRVRGLDGVERVLPSWENAVSEDLLGKWAMNQMLINVSTRRFKRSVRLPEGDVPASDGAGLSKSATSRRFVALSAARMKAWMETRLDDLDLLAIQIDGIHMDEDMLLVAAIGVDAKGDKHPLGLVEGATENATTVQALIDNLVERGLDPTVRRLFIIDGAKALSKAMRRSSVARFTRRATFWSGCPNRCTLRCGASCGKPGKWTTPKGPKRSFAISPAVSNRTGTAFPLRSWKGSTRCSLSRGSASLANCAARSPAPTSSRMSWARCARSAATSNTGARPRWPCDGQPPPCRKQPRASVD